ncbi:30S ribosomal protein S16 [Elusimicrobiota bacterium]
MTVRLRLQRKGKKKRPFYDVVAIDKRAARDAKPIEVLGRYDAVPNEKVIKINEERVNYWIKNGAEVSKTVSSIIKAASKANS